MWLCLVVTAACVVSDGEVVAAFAAALADIVSTKRPSVPLWQSRTVVAEALRAVCTGSRALPSSAGRAVAGAVIPALVAGIAKEVCARAVFETGLRLGGFGWAACWAAHRFGGDVWLWGVP